MADVVNLRLARKAKGRAERARVADANRVAHGVAKGERDAADAVRFLGERALNGVKRD